MFKVYKLAFENMRPVGFRCVAEYSTKSAALRKLNQIRTVSEYIDHSESYWEYEE